MILEQVILNVKPGEAAAFEKTFAEAQAIINAMPGYLSRELHACLEAENQCLLLVRWRTLLHHFYDPFPTVAHYRQVLPD